MTTSITKAAVAANIRGLQRRTTLRGRHIGELERYRTDAKLAIKTLKAIQVVVPEEVYERLTHINLYIKTAVASQVLDNSLLKQSYELQNGFHKKDIQVGDVVEVLREDSPYYKKGSRAKVIGVDSNCWVELDFKAVNNAPDSFLDEGGDKGGCWFASPGVVRKI